MKSCLRSTLLATIASAFAFLPQSPLRGEDNPQVEANYDSEIVKHALDGILIGIKKLNSGVDKKPVAAVSAEFEYYPGAVLYATNYGKARFYRACPAEDSLSVEIERIPP